MQKESSSKVSIIIPVYKVEDYFDECIQSVIGQTYKNLEIILIDDGSPDNSAKMCDDYAKIDDRIKVIHKQNGGQATARNLGIDIATGEYIAFVDSDDYVKEDIIETLLCALERNNADVSACRLTDKIEEYNKNNKSKVKIINSNKTIKWILKEKRITTSPTCKLFKREFFNGIRYQEGRIHEDLGTIYKVIDKANKIAFVDAYKYFYRCNPTSTTQSAFSRKQMDYFYIIDEMYGYMEEKHPEFLRLVINHKVRNSIAFIRRISMSGFDDKEVISILVKNVRKNIFGYFFSGYSLFSKLYGALICISPKVALKVFHKN